MVKPYKGGKYALMALLPKKFGRQYLHKALEQMNLSGLCQSRTRDYIVNVTMPEFTADFDEKMNDYCQNAGIRTAFTDQADFSPMSTSALKVGEIVHQAKIEVSRHGTKAAAVTHSDVLCGAVDRRDEKNVRLTRPFIYAIVHTETGLPAFTGIENKIAKDTK
jgi:serpin B